MESDAPCGKAFGTDSITEVVYEGKKYPFQRNRLVYVLGE